MTSIALPYLNHCDKIERLAPLLNKPWSMLLDSGGNQTTNEVTSAAPQLKSNSRYDIFCCLPSIELEAWQHQCHFKTTEYLSFSTNVAAQIESISSQPNGQPLNIMRQLLKVLSPQQKPTTLPFNGGWLGYISYDFGQYLEHFPVKQLDDIQLPEIRMGLYQWALISDHHTQQTRLHNFGLDELSWQNIQQLVLTAFNKTADATVTSQNNPFKLQTDWQSNTSSLDYQKAFNQIQQYIHDGDCYQVNYAQRFSAQYIGSPTDAYAKLSKANKSPFSAYLNFSDFQILSLSPERFIESHQGKVTTQPIKGTRPRDQDPIKDKQLSDELAQSEKDKTENLMIVDLLRNDLSRTAAKGSVNVSELFGLYQFESVHHLISTIHSTLADGYDNFDLLATTFPGGSITGAPKIRAMQIIQELEPVKRNIYCGGIGYIDFNGNMDTSICIRTLVCKNNQIYCWAGGGLVADSKLETEYQETFDKLAKILPLLKTSIE